MATEIQWMQKKGDFYLFSVYDSSTNKLLYSKYNFNFVSYSNDRNYNNLSKNTIFYNFLIENQTDFWKPFTVLEQLQKYFLPITEEIQNYFDDYNFTLYGENFNARTTYIKAYTLMNNEFDLVYYDFFTETPNLCEFLETTPDNKIISKYNFNFEKYSSDYNVYGSKLGIFYNFMMRIKFLSENVPGFIGFLNIPSKFFNYFYLDNTTQTNLQTFLDNYSIFSCFPNVKKCLDNINLIAYRSLINNKYNITLTNDVETKKYFIKFGQFQQDNIPFMLSKDSEIIKLTQSVCSIMSADSYGTGILLEGTREYSTDYYYYGGKKQVFLLTCYHIIENESKNVLYANCYYSPTKNIKLQFRIIGFDKFADICIAMYDDTLDYNIAFFPEEQWNIRTTLNLLNINADLTQYLGQTIAVIGNPGMIDNSSYLEGKIMDHTYYGTFNETFILGHPPTILSDLPLTKGYSGSPLFLRDPQDNLLKCVGVANAKINGSVYSLGVSSHLLNRIYSNTISYWFGAVSRFGINDLENISFNIRDTAPKKWLGIICQYYQSSLAIKIHPSFNSFTQNCGIIVLDFILGFNINTREFVYEEDKLSIQGVVKIDTPLLKSQMYLKFILNNRVPIVIKSVKLYDKIKGIYQTFNLGKYEDQYSFDVITYGLIQSGSGYNDTKYTNIIKRYYNTIVIEYYYFNGNEWLLTRETIGGSDSSWFNEYSDSYGNLFLQHKFDYPAILIPYLDTFTSGNNYEEVADGPIKEFTTPENIYFTQQLMSTSWKIWNLIIYNLNGYTPSTFVFNNIIFNQADNSLATSTSNEIAIISVKKFKGFSLTKKQISILNNYI